MCFEIMAYTTTTPPQPVAIYVVRAVNADGTFPVKTWPFSDSSGRAVFRYAGGTTQDAIDKVNAKQLDKPSSWSYIVFSLLAEPLDAVPPGAQLSLDKLPQSCSSMDFGSRIAYKLNPNVTFNKDATFDLIAPSGTGIDECGKALVVYSSQCASGSLNTPKLENMAPFEHQVHYSCNDSRVNVNVEFDECTGTVANVTCDSGGPPSPAVQTFNPYGYAKGLPADSTGATYRIFQILNMGPGTPGVTVCTGATGQPVYLRGNKAWWCGSAPVAQ